MSIVASAGKVGNISYVITDETDTVEVKIKDHINEREDWQTLVTWKAAEQLIHDKITERR